MNALARFTATAIFALAAATVTAHPNHGGPPIKREDVPVLGERLMKLLVQDKKLAASWQGRPAKAVSSQNTPDGPVWIVSYENPDEADNAKRVVYVFFDEFGNFIGGNHSGKLQ